MAAIFPGYAQPAVRFADWPNTPYVMTGNSVPSPQQVCSVGKLLSVPYGRLHFAGEQFYVPFFGYMEGGLRSGARAALNIVTEVCSQEPDSGEGPVSGSYDPTTYPA